MVRRSSEQATALLRVTSRTTRRSSLQGLHLPRRRLLEMAKREALSDSELMAPLVSANLETLLAQVMLQAKATQLYLEMVRPVPANRPLAEEDLDLLRTERRSVRVRPLAARVKLRDLRRRRSERFPFPLGRARQYLRCPGPCAFSREIPAARKCNREARCGGHPIYAPYRRPRNRRALAGCGNKCSRSQRKHARRARPFPIVALDRYQCLPRQTAD